MLCVTLKLHVNSGKLFVESWFVAPKAATITVVPGVRELIDMKNIPSGFFKNSRRYFVEDGVLRNGFGINE